jgi:uncharacterized protein YkwD
LLPLVILATALIGSSASSRSAVQIIADDLNLHREAAAISPLQIDGRLTELARERAQDMIRRHYFDHTNPDGESAIEMLSSRAYRFSYAGENISLASDEEQAEQGLWESPPHRQNMLGTHYRRVGIAVVQTPTDCYIVQIFTD